MHGVRRSARLLWQDRVAVDPGLLRLRLALRATLAVALSSAVLHFVGPAVGLPTVVAMLLGGMIGINGSFASSSRSPRDVTLTLAAFPVAAAAGAVPASLSAAHPVPNLVGFVIIMIVAVYVRRFGARWLTYGMLAWLTYFFTTFITLPPRQLPGLLVVVTCATACLVLVAAVLVPDRPVAIRAAAKRSFQARISALAATARDVVSGEIGPEQAQRQLHARTFRLVEAALILDGHFAGVGSRTAAGVRRGLVEAELAAEELAGAVGRLSVSRLPAAERNALVAALQALRDGRLTQARQAVATVRTGVDDAVPEDQSGIVRDALAAVDQMAQMLGRPYAEPPAYVGEYEPAVELYLGNLPGSGASAQGVLETSRLSWSLNTRLCVQTAVASPIALGLGYALSAQRYYWAVLACFLVLTGTLTTGEAAAKGANRVIGTTAGLVSATVAVRVTGGHDAAVVGVMLVAVFVGLYFFRVSYALMAFAVTTIMGELYEVLHEFSDHLLLLRLVETALGAGVAVLVVLVVLPLRTTDARAAAQTAFLQQLAVLLADLRDRLRAPGRTSNLLYDSRLLDARLHQLALVARPAAGATLSGLNTRSALRTLAGYTATAHRARSLAVAVTALEPGSLPELAECCEALRRRCVGEPAGTVALPSGPRDVRRRLAELDQALDALVGSRDRSARPDPALA